VIALHALLQHQLRPRLHLLDAGGAVRDLVLEHRDPLLDALGVGGGEVALVAGEGVPHAQVEAQQESELALQLVHQQARRGVEARVVVADLLGLVLELAIADALGIRQEAQHLGGLELRALLLGLRLLLGLARLDQALEAAVAGHERQRDHLDARRHQQGQPAPGDDREADGRGQPDDVVLALEGLGEIVRLLRQRLASSGSEDPETATGAHKLPSFPRLAPGRRLPGLLGP
jgi:hypothetical protein